MIFTISYPPIKLTASLPLKLGRAPKGKNHLPNIFQPIYAIGSMYGLFTYIWLKFMVNVGKYSTHGSRAQGPWFYRGKLAVSFREGTRKICCWIAPPCLDTPLALRIPNILTILLISLCQLLAKIPKYGVSLGLHVTWIWWLNNPSNWIYSRGIFWRKNDEGNRWKKKHHPSKLECSPSSSWKGIQNKMSLDSWINLLTTKIFLPKTRWSQWFLLFQRWDMLLFFWKVNLPYLLWAIKVIILPTQKLHFGRHIHHWLVVSTHLKNISQNGNLPQVGVKIKNLWVATTLIKITKQIASSSIPSKDHLDSHESRNEWSLYPYWYPRYELWSHSQISGNVFTY